VTPPEDATVAISLRLVIPREDATVATSLRRAKMPPRRPAPPRVMLLTVEQPIPVRRALNGWPAWL